jgi:hypothetical protein
MFVRDARVCQTTAGTTLCARRDGVRSASIALATKVRQ